jgi:ADP-ribosyl-[dinitrogen reductase] hydrolase
MLELLEVHHRLHRDSHVVTSLAQRLEGAIWGHLVGDALGVPYEFGHSRPAKTVRWGHVGTHGQPPGTWSDDGGLMLALLDSLLSAGFDPEDQARRALAWRDEGAYRPGPRFDIGATTDAALSRFKAGAPATASGGHRELDNGNGSLMRILPLALVRRSTTDADLVTEAMTASAFTHAHACSRLVCALYSLVVRNLLNGQVPALALAGASESVNQLASSDDRGELELILAFKTRSASGYVVDTFWSAWDAFASATNYQETVTHAIAYGGDTDTTACVAGGLAGVRWCISGIPNEWRTHMRGASIAEALITRLTASTTLDPKPADLG